MSQLSTCAYFHPIENTIKFAGGTNIELEFWFVVLEQNQITKKLYIDSDKEYELSAWIENLNEPKLDKKQTDFIDVSKKIIQLKLEDRFEKFRNYNLYMNY